MWQPDRQQRAAAARKPRPALQPRLSGYAAEGAAERPDAAALLLQHCTDAAAAGGFRTLELAATMPGVPLYLASGFEIVEEFEIALPGGVQVPLAKMRKSITAA
jgi:hypothetical protein